MVLPGTAVVGVIVLTITFCLAVFGSVWSVEVALLSVPSGSLPCGAVDWVRLTPTEPNPLLPGAEAYALAAADISMATKIKVRVVRLPRLLKCNMRA